MDFLTTSEGYNVLNQNLQPILVNSTEFTVEDNGQVVLNDGSVRIAYGLAIPKNLNN